MLTWIVKQQIKIMFNSKQAGIISQIFPNRRLSPNRQRYVDINLIRKTLCSMNRPADLLAMFSVATYKGELGVCKQVLALELTIP
jgi:hypothetical protein